MYRQIRPRRHLAAITLTLVAVAVMGCGSQAPVPGDSPGASTPAATDPNSAPTSKPSPATAVVLPVLADVPFYKGDAARSGVDPGPGPLVKPVEAWRAMIECSVGNRVGVIGSGLFVIGCDANKAIALDARTGIQRWAADLDGPMQGSPAIADGTIYVADAGGTFWSLDLASGTKRWSLPIKPVRHPVVVGGTVYVGTEDGRFLGLDPADGRERWSWQAPPGIEEVTGTVVDDTAYIGGGGTLYAASTSDGTTRWKLHVLSGRVSTPAITADMVFVASLQNGQQPSGEIYAVDRATGSERWRYRSPSGRQVAPPTTVDGVVYSPSSEDGLFAFGGSDGRIHWNVDTGIMGGQPPAIVGDVVYLATDRSLMAFGRSDGAKLWEVDLGADVDNSPIVSGGMVFIGDHAGVVRAFAEPAIAALLANKAASPTALPSARPSASAAPRFERINTFDASSSEIEQPSGMDVGPDGNLYVVNALKHEIVVLDPAKGSVIRRWGGKGSDPGRFNFLRDVNDQYTAIGGVAVAPNGSVYVADTVNRRVQQFDAKGTFIRQWGRFGSSRGQFLEPTDLDAGPDGDVFVVDDQRDDIQRFTADGTFVAVIGKHGTGPGEMNFTGGICIGRDSTLYNADWDNKRVQAWDENGTFLWTLGSADGGAVTFKIPADVVVDDTGRIYVTDEGRVQRFDADRTPSGALGTLAEYEEDQPLNLALGDGVLYVSVPFENKIHVLRIVP